MSMDRQIPYMPTAALSQPAASRQPWRLALCTTRQLVLGTCLLAALACQPAAQAQAQVGVGGFAEPTAAMPTPPEIAARAFILQDVSSHQTLASRNADQAMEPASLTKLMTAYLVFQALQSGKLNLNQDLVVSERAWRTGMTGASRSFVNINSRVKVEELVKGMVVQSGNDASVVLAEGVAGTEEAFVGMMNRQAQAFGLKVTHFANPEGLPAAGHVSTARELSIIASRLVSDFPQYMPYFSMKEYTINGIRQGNRNLLLYRDPSVDGLKTGYTDAAGYCLIASAHRPNGSNGERRLLSVVLGTASPEARANESQKLLNWGYSAFDVVRLYAGGQAVGEAQVWKGQQSSVKLGSLTPVIVVVPRGQAAALQTALTRNDPLLAPLSKGQTVGQLQIRLGSQVWQTLPLQALQAVDSAGWLGRLWDAMRLSLK